MTEHKTLPQSAIVPASDYVIIGGTGDLGTGLAKMNRDALTLKRKVLISFELASKINTKLVKLSRNLKVEKY